MLKVVGSLLHDNVFNREVKGTYGSLRLKDHRFLGMSNREITISNLLKKRAAIQNEESLLKKQYDDGKKILDCKCEVYYQKYILQEQLFRKEYEEKCLPMQERKLLLKQQTFILCNSIHRIESTIKNPIMNTLYEYINLIDLLEIIDEYFDCYCETHDKLWRMEKLCCNHYFQYEIKKDWTVKKTIQNQQISEYDKRSYSVTHRHQYPVHFDDINYLYDLWLTKLSINITKDENGILNFSSIDIDIIHARTRFKTDYGDRLYMTNSMKQFYRIF